MSFNFYENSEEYSNTISEILITLGVFPKYAGFNYLKSGILYAIYYPEAVNNLSKEFYPKVASICNTSVGKLQSAIRNVLEVIYDRGYVKKINGIFGFKVVGDNDKLTSSEFIGLLSNEYLIRRFISRKQN